VRGIGEHDGAQVTGKGYQIGPAYPCLTRKERPAWSMWAWLSTIASIPSTGIGRRRFFCVSLRCLKQPAIQCDRLAGAWRMWQEPAARRTEEPSSTDQVTGCHSFAQ
jgi:hypothetical protein